MNATLDNIRSYRGISDDALRARLADAGTGFDVPTYNPRRGPATSDPKPVEVTDAMRAEIRERLGRGHRTTSVPTVARTRMDNDTPDAPGRVDNGEPMRDKQAGLVHVLLRQLGELNAEAARAGAEWFEAQRAGMTKVQASAWIDRIRLMIAKGPAEVSAHDIRTCTAYPCDRCSNHRNTPAPMPEAKANAWTEWRDLAAECVAVGGRYGARFAVETDEGHLAFWWISPSDGPYGKRYFLRQVIGGQGAVRVRMSPEAMIGVARKILAAGPYEAMIRYGQEIGECGHCGRVLTNPESRAAGIGPVCRKGH